ncbi:MAG TPA: ABC transporter permease [Acidimicrobiia bacterium]|nr:ABC transporter permease [Acidimicrobiia bacterium]
MSVLALFRHHVRMLFRRGRLFLVTLLAVTPAGVLLIGGLADADPPTEIAGLVANIGARTFPIVALILASSTLRDERDDGTLPYLYMTPISRPVMAVTSIAAGITVTALVGVVAAAAITVAAAWIGADIGFGVAAFPAYVAAALGYAPLFVPAGYLVPRVILVGLGYVILWEQIVAYLVTGVANTSVWRFALSVYADLVPAGDGDLAEALGPVAPGVGGGVAKVAVVAVAGWLLLTWALRRRDAM